MLFTRAVEYAQDQERVDNFYRRGRLKQSRCEARHPRSPSDGTQFNLEECQMVGVMPKQF